MPTARKRKASLRLLFCLLITGALFLLRHDTSLALVATDFHYATGVNTNLSSPWTNITNVIGPPDGLTSQVVNSFGLLYLKFDEGFSEIPTGSTITSVDIKVTFRGTGKWDPFIDSTSFIDQCSGAQGMFGITPLNNTSLADYTSTTQASACTYLTESRLRNGQIYLRFVRDVLFQSYTVDAIGMRVTYNPPMPTPSPTPSPVQTFLDLPWDYEAKGQTFADAALSINSYFDHSYPLLSSGLFEPTSYLNQITTFKNENSTTKNYSSHDGYDYAIGAGVHLDDPVLAAAAGTAEYIDSCAPCGNMILIDHGNGYQTRYLHMQKDGLIVSTPGVKINVSSHQQIGKVGASGNVSPAGNAGAHIHFGVFEDKNHDGNFNDNVPDGVTDPFGWQSSEPDPWENYSFFYNGLQRTGNKSYYLWKKALGNTSTTLSPSGGNLNSGHYFMTFPSNAVSQNTSIELTPEPIISPSNILSSMGPTLLAIAIDQFGNPVTDFLNPFTLVVDFANLDISRFDLSTLSIYSSQDGVSWTKEPTLINFTNQKASTTLSHFTHFALMANRLDITPPSTTATLSGDKGEENWYRSDVTLLLNAQDNQGGLGVDYTVFGKEGEDWDIYSSPIIATDEGHFKYEFYSVDNDGNIEDKKTIEFAIDKTPPTITSNATIDGNPYIPGTWTNKDVLVTFACTDSFSGVSTFTDPVIVSSEGENQSIAGECMDKTGNVAITQFSGINIDKTPPVISVFADPSILWPPNGKFVPVKISGFIQELNLADKTFNIIDEYNMTMPNVNDFGDTVFLQALRNENDFNGRKYIINVEAADLAGNKSNTQTEVIVPHDQRKK